MHQSPDFRFGQVDLLRVCQDGIFVLLWDYDDAIGIPAQDIALLHARIADVDRSAQGFHLYTILAGAHRIAAAVDGISELARQVRIAARAVDHRARDAPAIRDPRENIAPHRGVLAPAVIEHND